MKDGGNHFRNHQPFDPMRPFTTSARATLLALAVCFTVLSVTAQIPGIEMPPDDGKLRIIAFGAHPDDCEIQIGGTAAL
jgi:hypothetical protein